MKCSHLYFLFLLLVFFAPQWSFGQTMTATNNPASPAQDSVTISVLGLPEQIVPVSASGVTPSYRYFYIYGDGDFGFFDDITESKHSTNHRFPYPLNITSGPQVPYYSRAYGIGIYSNGDRPPKPTRTNLINSPSDPTLGGTIEKTRIVHQDSFLRLMPHAQAKMGEPLIYVIAVRNPLDQMINNAQLFLLFESEIKEIITSKKGLSVVNSTGSFGEFPIKDVLIQSQRISSAANLYESSLSATTKSIYQRVLAFNLSELDTNAEEHIFLELEVDSTMFQAFNGKNTGLVNFTAVLHTQDGALQQVNYLNTQQTNQIASFDLTQSLGLMATSPADSLYNYLSNVDSTIVRAPDEEGGVVSNGNYLGITTSSISLVKEHDPNFLRAVGCACPKEGERKKLFVTLHAENDGQGDVFDVYFDMALPAGITAADIVGTPIAHHPTQNTALVTSIDSIEFQIIDDKHVRWHMRSQFIEPISKYGPEDPRTFAEIQFELSTDVALNSLDSMLITCVRFNSEANAPVCTYPVAVSLIETPSGQLAQILNCSTTGECATDGNGQAWPWWYWLLMILFILLLIFLILFLLRRS